MPTYSFTGAAQQYVVPAGVVSLQVDLIGGNAARGAGLGGSAGATGRVTGTLAVTPGETLYIFVGGNATAPAGGWNGGGNGGTSTTSYGGGGGGATDIRRGGTNLANRLAVAAGGGGGGGTQSGFAGGAAGPTGAAGAGTNGGTGGTQTAGGTTGGALGVGGSAGTTNRSGGGGGGYYGGGAGVGTSYDGGGGGSNYVGGLQSVTLNTSISTTVVGAVSKVVLTPLNVAPNAPVLTNMASGETVATNVVNRATHEHSDPNGSPQAGFDIQYRLRGAATWTVINVPNTTAQWYDFPANTFAVGDYERQVRTYDTEGLAGPWSPSGFFTAAVPPGAPAITAPANGATLTDPSTSLTWTATAQDAYQVRRVADNAGNPDTALIYADTGEVTSTTVRTYPVKFDVDNRWEHLQVRVKKSGLWSPWASARVLADYATPPAPTFVIVLAPDDGAIDIQVANPAPGPGQAPAIANDIYITEPVNGVVVEQRRVSPVAVNGSWRYWTPISGVDYSTAVRVEAVAANGSATSSS